MESFDMMGVLWRQPKCSGGCGAAFVPPLRGRGRPRHTVTEILQALASQVVDQVADA